MSISRRRFLRDGSLYGGGLWIAIHLPRPLAARAAEQSAKPVVLTQSEWQTVEVITARIIPTDHEPGAVEAGCVNFIDKALANEDAQALPLYRLGVAGADAVARERFGEPLAKLSAAQQDEILTALEDGSATGWPEGPISSPVFFETVRAHTLIGFLADPKYGGNRGYAGWKLVGYPGPRHHRGGYTPDQMLGTAPIEAVWGERLESPRALTRWRAARRLPSI